ncbi:MAG: hypothetical protein M5U01_13520 [Ardenticatenaceae bacterium]|nr:hypothetical protein [Ardenticatenaceae bacterium]
MARAMTQEERKRQMLAAANRLVERLEGWYDAHPEATFEEVEAAAREARREMMGAVLGVMINGRDTGLQAEAPRCPRCQGGLRFKGYRRKRIIGLEGDTTLERAYYVCPDCKGETFFPPGPQTLSAG